MNEKIIIIQGSKSDNDYVDQIVSALEPYGIPVIRRIASAHRTPLHLQKVLDQYDNSDKTVFITVAGLSDALSGTVAARYSGRVIACPPDFKQYGDAKVFSSTATPSIEVLFARNPQEAAILAKTVIGYFNLSREDELRRRAVEKRNQTIKDDAILQGVEPAEALPYTLFKKGKTRDVYDLGDGTLLIRASDRVSAFDVVMHEKIPKKGESLTSLSEYWFRLTQNIFPNHFIERVDERSIRVKKADRVNIEWVVRGRLYGSLARAYERGERILYGINFPDGLVLAQELPQPILTATTKADRGHDEPITKEEAVARGLVRSEEEWDLLENAAFELHQSYKQRARRIIIADLKLEFGKVDGNHTQIDEPPNHDSARLWAERFYQIGRGQESHALDKEFLRQYLMKIDYTGNGEPPHLLDLVVDQVSRRCIGAFQMITGRETDITKLGLMSVEEVMNELKR